MLKEKPITLSQHKQSYVSNHSINAMRDIDRIVREKNNNK